MKNLFLDERAKVNLLFFSRMLFLDDRFSDNQLTLPCVVVLHPGEVRELCRLLPLKKSNYKERVLYFNF